LGIGDWGLGIGDWGLGPIPNPQSPYDLNNLIITINLIFFFLLILNKVIYHNHIENNDRIF
jgi:hypothetical protein